MLMIEIENGDFSAACPFCGKITRYVTKEKPASPYYRYRGRVIPGCKHFWAYEPAKGKTGMKFIFKR